MSSPAGSQSAEAIEPSVIVDPASIVDLDRFAARAAAWVDAREEWRLEAIEFAEELASDVREAEAAALERERSEAAAAQREAAEAAALTSATTTTTTTTTTTAPPATTAPPTPTTTTPDETTVPEGGPTAEQWAALRMCESSGNYQAVNPSGKYRGAYQFSIETWDWLASKRFPALVGVDPIDAAPPDQDAMAQALYDIYGPSPWPTCGRHLS